MMKLRISSILGLLLTTCTHFELVHGDLDIAFLIDTSATMSEDLGFLKDAIDDIVASTQSLGTGTRYGLATFEDYPVAPFGNPAGDVPYNRVTDLTASTTTFTNLVKALQVGDGENAPGSQLTAVRQLLDGTEQTLDNGFEVSEELMSFDEDSRQVVVLYTDSNFNTPMNITGYPGPNFSEVITLLQDSSVNFVGLNAGGAADDGLTSLATYDLQRLVGATDTKASAIVDCGSGGGPDIEAGHLLVCTQVGGSIAAVRQGFINT